MKYEPKDYPSLPRIRELIKRLPAEPWYVDTGTDCDKTAHVWLIRSDGFPGWLLRTDDRECAELVCLCHNFLEIFLSDKREAESKQAPGEPEFAMSWQTQLLQLEWQALAWLRYDRRCLIVMLERSPWQSFAAYRPDVIGITPDRRIIEIEIKLTLADLRANSRKKFYGWPRPWKRYYLVPAELVEQARPMLTEDWGLMFPGTPAKWPGLVVTVPARVFAESKQMTMKQFFWAIRHQSGTLVSAIQHNRNLAQRLDELGNQI